MFAQRKSKPGMEKYISPSLKCENSIFCSTFGNLIASYSDYAVFHWFNICSLCFKWNSDENAQETVF